MNMTEILKSAVERGASDIFVVAGLPLTPLRSIAVDRGFIKSAEVSDG